jgi:transcription antitermination factor NusG
MSTDPQLHKLSDPPPFFGIGAHVRDEHWFAIHTYARHEKTVAQEIRGLGMTSFLPTVKRVRQWSDRRKVVEFPIFSCYVFAKLPPTHEYRLKVLRINGVLKFVGIHGAGIPIPEEQINALRVLVEEQLPLCSHPFLKLGQRVRIRSGALSGVEGILISRNGARTLVVSVDAIQRSLSVQISGYDVEPA